MDTAAHTEVPRSLQERFEAVTRDRSPEDQIREFCDGASDEAFIEIARFIRSQPAEYPDSGGDMATDEIPGWRERMWYAFGCAALEADKARFATTALAEMGPYSHSVGNAQRLAEKINELIPPAVR